MEEIKHKEIFKSILTSFIDTYNSFYVERGKKRPQSLRDMGTERLEAIKKAVCESIRDGIQGEIEKNTLIENYSPFSDAIASEVAGKINLKFQCVIKAGGKQLEDQIHFIETKRPEYKPLYPALLGEMKFNINKDEYNYVCVMENLVGYSSLHEMIFKSDNQDKRKISRAIDLIFDVLFEMYQKESNQSTIPKLEILYLKDRILNRIDIGRKRFNSDVKFPPTQGVFQDFDDLLEKEIEFEQVVLKSFNECLSSIKDKLDDVTPSFTTLVHGDAHPGNIMINLSDSDNPLKFIDPNAYIQNSDYLYDMGKMIHWLDKFGFLALERATSKKIISVTPQSSNSKIKIDYKFDSNTENLPRIFELKDYSLDYTYKKIEAIADEFKDVQWQKRLDLSISSAYIGGLAYAEEASHFLICFVEALKYLNNFIFSDS